MFLRSSLFYRVLSGSWLLGWLADQPPANYHIYETSWLYRQCDKITESAFTLLTRSVNKLKACSDSSRLSANPLQFMGILLFICLLMTLAFNYSAISYTRLVPGMVLAVLLVLFPYWRVIWANSFIYRVVSWWNDTE